MTGFVTDHAPRPAEFNACIQCGLCLPFCPTFRLTGDERYSPRGRLSAMSAVAAGAVELDEAFDDAMSTCLGCRACEAVCPGLVPYGRAYEGAKAELMAQRPTAGRRLRRVLLGRLVASRGLIGVATTAAGLAQRFGVRRVLPRGPARSLAGLRPLLPRRRSWRGRTAEPVGAERGTVALLAGCVMDAWFGAVHAATVGVLTRAGYRVTVPSGQTCCGALAAHDGHIGEAERLARLNLDALAPVVSAPEDLVVADAAGCSAHLAEYGNWVGGGDVLASKVRDVTTLVAELVEAGHLPKLPATGVRVAVQDPCHLRHAQRQYLAPRAVVRAAGFVPVEIDHDGICCGAAGVYSVLQAEISAELGRRKARQVAATAASVVASANPGCEMQLRGHLGSGYDVRHPVELYWNALVEHGSGYGSAPVEAV